MTTDTHRSDDGSVTRLGHAPVVSIRSPKAERLAKQGREAAIRMMAATKTDDVPAEVPGNPTRAECIQFATRRMQRVADGPAPEEFKSAFEEAARTILTMVYGHGWEVSVA